MPPTNSTGRYPAFTVSLRVGFGWAFLMLLCQGISRFWSLSLRDKLSEAFVICLIAIGSYVILEDIFERLKGIFGIDNEGGEHEIIPASWRAIAIATIVLLASTSHSLLHDIFGDLVVHQGILGTARLLIYTYALGACCLLWVWIRGAGRQPPRAKRYGLGCGAIIAAVSVATIIFWTLGQKNPHPLSPRADLSSFTITVLMLEIWAIVVIPYPLFGFVGGWVVDSGRFRRPTFGIVMALAIANVAYHVFFSALARTWIPWSFSYLYPVAVWWVAFALNPEADKLLTVQKPGCRAGALKPVEPPAVMLLRIRPLKRLALLRPARLRGSRAPAQYDHISASKESDLWLCQFP